MFFPDPLSRAGLVCLRLSVFLLLAVSPEAQAQSDTTITGTLTALFLPGVASVVGINSTDGMTTFVGDFESRASPDPFTIIAGASQYIELDNGESLSCIYQQSEMPCFDSNTVDQNAESYTVPESEFETSIYVAVLGAATTISGPSSSPVSTFPASSASSPTTSATTSASTSGKTTLVKVIAASVGGAVLIVILLITFLILQRRKRLAHLQAQPDKEGSITPSSQHSRRQIWPVTPFISSPRRLESKSKDLAVSPPHDNILRSEKGRASQRNESSLPAQNHDRILSEEIRALREQMASLAEQVHLNSRPGSSGRDRSSEIFTDIAPPSYCTNHDT